MARLFDRTASIATAWMSFGVYFFTVAFFWATGVASVRTAFYLFLLLPALALLPWRKAHWRDFGGAYTLWALASTGFIALSSFWAIEENFSKLLRAWLMLAFWLAISAFVVIRGHLSVARLLNYLVAIAAVAALGEIIYFYGVLGNPLGARLSAHGIAENPTLTAQVFGAMAVVGYVKSLQSSAARSRWLWLLAAGICTLPLLLSQTRGAWMAFAPVVIAALVLTKPPKHFLWMQLGVGVGLAVILLWQFNFSAILEARGLDVSDRHLIWQELLARAYQDPLLGIGAEYNGRIIIPDVDVFHHAHNPVIDTLYYAGLVGVFLLLCQLQMVMHTFSRDPEILPVYLWWVFGVLAMLTNAPHLLAQINVYWMAYWIPAGLLAGLAIRQARARIASAPESRP